MFLAIVNCWPPLSIEFVGLTNLPVFIIWGEVAELTANTNLDQFRLFYLVNGIGIPAFWFSIGLLLDRRRLKQRPDSDGTYETGR
jgi:hypothetical protein